MTIHEMNMHTNIAEKCPWVLQFCHGYEAPFLDCARQYAALFSNTPFRVCTVYLTGPYNSDVVKGSASDEVVFLEYSSQEIRGLKLDAIRSFRKIVRSHVFKFCIAHRFKPTYIALLGSKIPVIGVQHAFGVYSRRSRRLFANLFKSRLTLLGVSNAVRNDIRAALPNWEEHRIETLHNRIDIQSVRSSQFNLDEAREILKLPQKAWIVGNVGRLHPDKDQITLIRGFALALPQLPADTLLAIMGSGHLEPSLKELTHQLGIEKYVRFLGQVQEARRFFKAFDVFVLTSDHEPFGMVLLEAMAAGIPIVCSDCGGAQEIVRGVGQLFPLGNVFDLATALKQQAQLGQQERGRLCSRQNEALEAHFSDKAARRVFWALNSTSTFGEFSPYE